MFRWHARRIRKSPKLILAALGAVTLALLAGFLVRDQPRGRRLHQYLPARGQRSGRGHRRHPREFPAAADLRVVQILAKGDVLAAESLRAVKDLQTAIISDAAVEPYLVDEPLYGYVPDH